MANIVKLPMGVEEIQKIIPHRDPFLFVDGVTAFEDIKFIEGYKKWTGKEDFFSGHFPGRPILPGVIMLEALAQLGAIFAKLATGGVKPGNLLVFSGTDECRFRRLVVPGDVINLRMELIKSKFGHWKMLGTGMIGEEKAIQAVLTATEVS